MSPKTTRIPTPRGMPALPVPALRSPLSPAPKPLARPVKIVCGPFEYELRQGSVLVGRGPECEIILEDSLVSRLHARVEVDDEGVRIEDLYSTNGVYLNGERIQHARLIHEGDRVFIGSHEMTFVEVPKEPISSSPSTPPLSARFAPSPEPPTYKMVEARGLPADIPITARADALDLLGSLARRLANDVKAEQAPRMLGPHLEGILRGASAGLVVPESLGEIASEYAIDLAHWTGEVSWLDYVVELHLVTKRVMSAGTLTALQRSERWVGHLDRTRLEYYIGSFSPRSGELDASARARLATLRRILKKK
jgi:hypothetical protein